MRGPALLTGYLVGVGALLWYLCVMPGTSLAFIASGTNYAQVVRAAEQIAYEAAQAAPLASKVAAQAVGGGTGSYALRLVTGPVGWTALGVVAVGLTVADIYYSRSQLSALQTAAAPAGGPTIPGYTPPTGATMTLRQGSGCGISGGLGCNNGSVDQIMMIGTSTQYYVCTPTTQPPTPPGWTFGGCFDISWPVRGWAYQHPTSSPSTAASVSSGTATQAQVASYLQGLSNSDPLSIPSNTQAKGTTGSPRTADVVESLPVSPADMPTHVDQKPIAPTSSIVQDNVPPPAGTQTTTSNTQGNTATKTTTTNPDGSTTSVVSDSASVTCSGSAHENRTYASVWATHKAAWLSNGWLGAVSVMQTFQFPSTFQVTTFTIPPFGTHSIDVSSYAWVFETLRAFLIFCATFLGFRLIFG